VQHIFALFLGIKQATTTTTRTTNSQAKSQVSGVYSNWPTYALFILFSLDKVSLDETSWQLAAGNLTVCLNGCCFKVAAIK